MGFKAEGEKTPSFSPWPENRAKLFKASKYIIGILKNFFREKSFKGAKSGGKQ